ncbi:pyruvate dehydrogenase (acetyl-transferring) E1 component subunit alpha, partial [Streptomyces ardesiacus]
MTESTAARKPRRSAGSKAAGTTGTKAAGTTGTKAGTGKRTTRSTRTAARKGTEPELVQLLTPEGERVEDAAHAEYASYVADITPEELRGLYRDMVLTRRFDAEATALQRQAQQGGPQAQLAL